MACRDFVVSTQVGFQAFFVVLSGTGVTQPSLSGLPGFFSAIQDEPRLRYFGQRVDSTQYPAALTTETGNDFSTGLMAFIGGAIFKPIQKQRIKTRLRIGMSQILNLVGGT